MSKAVFFNTYKLKKGVSIPEFLEAVENLNNAYISKLKGYVSFEVYEDGTTWADATTFETMEDAKAFASACEPNEYAEKFYSFLNLSTCKSHFFSAQKTYLAK